MTTLSNLNLKRTLEKWVEELDACLCQQVNSDGRYEAIKSFCLDFVPEDVKHNSEDMDYFIENLVNDHEFIVATRRELHQCATGIKVERIKGDQIKRAVFTLLPLLDLAEGEGKSLDIVREVVFISTDGGIVWTAEVRTLVDLCYVNNNFIMYPHICRDKCIVLSVNTYTYI
jgi:hypothetical protein